jgi:UDP-glucose 4-epimerase
MSNFVITGGAGFIGSHLADALLQDGHSVRILDDFSTGRRENLDPRCAVVTGDVADRKLMRDALEGADGCFHLAAIASVARCNEDWLGTHRTNQTGTIAVLEAARDAGRLPIVYASSAAVYGDLGNRTAREDAYPQPRTAYGADKLGSELHARVGFIVHRVPTLGFRFFNVYGPRQDPSSPYSGVISIFAKRIADGAQVTIHGDGRQTRDFVFVSDVVAHLKSGMEWLSSEGGASVLNVCTGEGTSIHSLLHSLGKLHNGLPKIVYGPSRTGDIRQSIGDPKGAISRLGVRASVPLEKGLAATLSQLQVRSEETSASHSPIGWRPVGGDIQFGSARKRPAGKGAGGNAQSAS